MSEPSYPTYSPSKRFTFPMRVYIEDTDAGGIVYYVNYLKFMERARTEFMRSLGFEQQLGPHSQFQFVVHSAEMKFLKAARMDMKIQVSVSLEKLAKSYFVVRQQVCDEKDDICFCEASIKVACVANQSFKPQAMPVSVHRALSDFNNY